MYVEGKGRRCTILQRNVFDFPQPSSPGCEIDDSRPEQDIRHSSTVPSAHRQQQDNTMVAMPLGLMQDPR